MSMPFRLPRLAPRRSASPGRHLHPYVELAARYWAVVVAATVIGAVAAFGLSQLATPTYSARSTLYFSIGYGTSGSDLNQGATYAQGQMLSFAELARTQRVLQPVVTSLELPMSASELASQVEVTTPANTAVLNITVSSGNPAEAAAIANSIADSLTQAVQGVAPRDADGKATVAVRTVETADEPGSPSAPNVRVNVVAGALIGLALSLLAIAAMRLLDTRVRGRAGVAAGDGLPILASLRDGYAADFFENAASGIAEDYRRLVATLDAVAIEPTTQPSARRARVFVIAGVAEQPAISEAPARHTTGPSSGGDPADPRRRAEVVAANLAAAAVEAGYRVALLTDVERDSAAEPASAKSAVTVRQLPARGRLASALLNAHDLVIVASPGSADGSRALRLAQLADGVVVLADEGRVHVGELRASIELLRTAGARVVGTVLTGEPDERGTSSGLVRSWTRRPLPVVLEHNQA